MRGTRRHRAGRIACARSSATTRASTARSSPSCRFGRSSSAASATTDFARYVIERNINRVIVTQDDSSERVLETVRYFKEYGLKVSVLPSILEVVGSSVEFDEHPRHDDARRPVVRALALVAAPQARLRPRRRARAARARLAGARRDRDRDQARLARAGASSARRASGATGCGSRCQVPHDVRGRRRAAGRAGATATRPTACSRSSDDPRVTRVGRLPAPHVARRAAAAPQRRRAAR